jgi:hypothetical protein
VIEGKKEEPAVPGEDPMEHLKRKLSRLENLEAYPTLSAVDNKNLGAVADSFSRFLKTLAQEKIPLNKFFEAANNSTNFSHFRGSEFENFDSITGLRDMGDLLVNIKNAPWCTPKLKKSCNDLQKKMAASLVNEMHDGENSDRYHGLTLNVPTNAGVIQNDLQAYKNNVGEFDNATGWGDFLEKAAEKAPREMREEFVKQDGVKLPEKMLEKDKAAGELKSIEDADKRNQEMLETKKKVFSAIKDPALKAKMMSSLSSSSAINSEDRKSALKKELSRISSEVDPIAQKLTEMAPHLDLSRE